MADQRKVKFAIVCLICGGIVEAYDYPVYSTPKICDECKKAVEFAKELRNKDSVAMIEKRKDDQ